MPLPENAEQLFVYVGLKDCGCAVSICIDHPDHKEDVREFINESLDSDLHITRMTREEGIAAIQLECVHRLGDEEIITSAEPEAAGQERLFAR